MRREDAQRDDTEKSEDELLIMIFCSEETPSDTSYLDISLRPERVDVLIYRLMEQILGDFRQDAEARLLWLSDSFLLRKHKAIRHRIEKYRLLLDYLIKSTSEDERAEEVEMRISLLDFYILCSLVQFHIFGFYDGSHWERGNTLHEKQIMDALVSDFSRLIFQLYSLDNLNHDDYRDWLSMATYRMTNKPMAN